MKLIQLVEGCCGPLVEAPLDHGEAERLAGAFKVLADPARLRLLSFIAAQPKAECCVCDLIAPAGLSQPTVSHHLKVLHDAGFLSRTKRGNWVFYRIEAEPLKVLQGVLAPPALAPSA